MRIRLRRPFLSVLVAALLTATLLTGARPDAAAQPAGPWSSRAEMLQPRSEIAVAELAGKIYVAGGYPMGRVPSDVLQVYDVATDTWSLGPRLPVPIHHTMLAAVDGRLFLIGGEVDGAGSGRPAIFVANVYELDLASDIWVERAPMPTGRSGGGVAVIGGAHDFAVYDVAADRWTVLPDLPTQRNHLAVDAIDGRVYVAGGRVGGGVGSEMTAVLEVYDPATGRWSSAAPMPAPRAGVTAITANGCLYVIGGEGNDADPRGIFEQVEAYDPRTDTWATLTPMPIPTHGLTGAALVDGRIHVPGGAVTRGGDTGTTLHQVYTPERSCR
jgi:N-acetylneuraminic acid mutarotase